MSYNNQLADTRHPQNYLVFDVETCPDDLPPELIEEIDAPANYKDQAKIDTYKADARAKEVETRALDPDKARVICIGWRTGTDGEDVLQAPDQDSEVISLSNFWRAWSEHEPRVGFNALDFDLPVLIRRSQILGVPHPRIDLSRYHADAIDLAEILTFQGRKRLKKLTWYARRFGLPVADTTSGKDIPALAAAGDWNAIRQHCAADVALTHALAARLGVVR